MTENYRWGQEIDEINVDIDFKDKSAKSVSIVTFDRDLTVKCGDEVLLSGRLLKSIYTGPKNVLWYVEDEKLFITMNKKEKGWWDSLFEDSAKIDINEYVHSKDGRFGDLDEEAQMVVEKMLSEQSEKAKLQKKYGDL